MEMEVLTWIPEFYNQLQDTLKEWLLASLPFVYGQKPEIKVLIHQPNLSAHNNSVRTQRWISFSVQVANSYLLLWIPSSPDLCSAMKPSGAGRRAAAAQRQAGHWLAGDEQLCCVPRALYSVFVIFFLSCFSPPTTLFLLNWPYLKPRDLALLFSTFSSILLQKNKGCEETAVGCFALCQIKPQWLILLETLATAHFCKASLYAFLLCDRLLRKHRNDLIHGDCDDAQLMTIYTAHRAGP